MDATADEPGATSGSDTALDTASETAPGTAPEQDAADGRPRALSRWLIVIASVLAVIATFSTWVRSELLDTDEWVEVSTDLLAEPEIQDALTTYLSNQLFEHVDLASDLESRLPDELGGLAGPLAGAMREPITNAIGTIISSDRFAQRWEDANRVAHQTMVAILLDETRPGTSATDGTVSLQLGTIIQSVGERVGLPAAALDRIPDDAGTVVIFESDQLASAQRGVQLLNFLSWFLFIAVVGLYVAAVVVARPHWRRALRNVGLALVVVGVVLILVRGIGIQLMANLLVENARNEPLVVLTAQVATRMVVEGAWTAIVYGALAVGFATLLGPAALAVSIRRQIGRMTESTMAATVTTLLGILLMLWWSPGRSFDRLVSAIVFVVVVIASIVSLVVISRREYVASLTVE